MPESRCTLYSRLSLSEHQSPLSFSLMNYRNNLFISNSINDLFSFYESFPDLASLINWMKERPRATTSIFEFDGRKDIIVVIPTADINSELAKSCRNSVFQGLHIIFVESGFPRDDYFNYAHSCNVGIEHALHYDPKWIVISNDDVERIDDVSKLIEELDDNHERDQVIWTNDNEVFTHKFYVAKSTFFLSSLMKLSPILRKFIKCRKIETLYFLEKYKIHFNPQYSRPYDRPNSGLLYRTVEIHRVAGSFAIYNSDLIRSLGNKLFDETFINGFEDSWLGIQLDEKEIKCGKIDYRIKPIGGSSLGKGYLRYLRDYVNLALYNYYKTVKNA